MINFHIPDFFSLYNLNTMLINMMNGADHDKFMSDIKIHSAYGSFPNMYWNGGRLCRGEQTDIEDVKNVICHYNSMGISIALTLTNMLIDEYLLHDPYCNMITDRANVGNNNYAIVNNDLMRNYIKNNYPNLKLISSTTKCILDADEVNRECEEYDMVCIDYRKNIDKNFLDKLKYKDKIEILVNAYCSQKCFQRKEHYKKMSEQQLYKTSIQYSLMCENLSTGFHKALENDTVIKTEDLYRYFVDKGFSHFKIEGRTLHPFDVIESYIYYLVKPEYKDEIRDKMVKQLWKNPYGFSGYHSYI